MLRAEEPVLPPEAIALLTDGAFVSSNPKLANGSIEHIGDGWRLTSPGKLVRSSELALSRNFAPPIAEESGVPLRPAGDSRNGGNSNLLGGACRTVARRDEIRRAGAAECDGP